MIPVPLLPGVLLALVVLCACGDDAEPHPTEPGYTGAVVCTDAGEPRCVPDRGPGK